MVDTGHLMFPGMEHRPAPGWLTELKNVFAAPPATWKHRVAVLGESVYFCVPAVLLGWASGIGVDALFRLFKVGTSQALTAVAVALQLLFSALVVIAGRALLRLVPAPTDAFRNFRNGNSMIAADLIFTVCLFASQIQLADRQRRLFDSLEPVIPEPPLDVTVTIIENQQPQPPPKPDPAAPAATPASTPTEALKAPQTPAPTNAGRPAGPVPVPVPVVPPLREPFGLLIPPPLRAARTGTDPAAPHCPTRPPWVDSPATDPVDRGFVAQAAVPAFKFSRYAPYQRRDRLPVRSLATGADHMLR